MIFNPTAARGRAARRLARVRQALGPRADFRPTAAPGHAVELAAEAAGAGYRTVAAAGGDGTVHEVANGILRAGRPDVVFAPLPLGSANDYAQALGVTLDRALDPAIIPTVRPVDVGRVTAPDGRARFFVNTLGLGFSGAVALESRRVRYLQGLALYGLAFLRALCLRFQKPVMEVTIDGHARRGPTLSLTVAVGPRDGSFVVAPDARFDDGLFDYLLAGALSRREVLRYMPRLASGGTLPADHSQLWTGHCREVRLTGNAALTVHTDGEFFARPEDGVCALRVEMLPGALRIAV